ncbi:hypothetical protein GCM10009624_19280 [Gordonia sinesedis]
MAFANCAERDTGLHRHSRTRSVGIELPETDSEPDPRSARSAGQAGDAAPDFDVLDELEPDEPDPDEPEPDEDDPVPDDPPDDELPESDEDEPDDPEPASDLCLTSDGPTPLSDPERESVR